jgi:hypothetical protein
MDIVSFASIVVFGAFISALTVVALMRAGLADVPARDENPNAGEP